MDRARRACLGACLAWLLGAPAAGEPARALEARLALAPGEAIWGLTERIADSASLPIEEDTPGSTSSRARSAVSTAAARRSRCGWLEDLWEQYLLGDDLLVAPVSKVGVRERVVKLPAGAWHDFWDRSRRTEGPATIRAAAPLGRIPVFVRAAPTCRSRRRRDAEDRACRQRGRLVSQGTLRCAGSCRICCPSRCCSPRSTRPCMRRRAKSSSSPMG